MLKISKQLDVLLCHLETPFNYSTVSLESGWYQIKRDKEMYRIYSLKDFTKPVQTISSVEMPELTKKVFVHLLNDGFYEEEDVVEQTIPQRRLKLA